MALEWVGVALAAAIAYAVSESYRLRITHYVVTSPRLPKAFDGMRVLHLSDLHITHNGIRERILMRLVMQRCPALLMVTGDIVHCFAGVKPAAAVLNTIAQQCLKGWHSSPPEPHAFISMGNCEVRASLTDIIAGQLRRGGIVALVNRAMPVRYHDEFIWVAGVHDPHRQLADARAALRDVPDDAFVILLAHSPDIVDDPEAHRADLLLCGHTHGGQVRLPFIGAVYTATRGGGRDYEYGAYQLNDSSVLITSAGVGSTRLPVRFLCPPEVVEITLKRDSAWTVQRL